MNSVSKIKKLNSLLSLVCLVLIVALPVADLIFWANFQYTSQYLDFAQSGVLQIETIETWQILSAALFSLATTLVLVIGLWNLRLLFISFEHGEFFTAQSTRSMHLLSKVLFLSTALRCLNSAVLSVILTWNNGPGEKALIVSVGANELWLVIIAATFLTITWSFKEGQRLARENAQFV